MSFFLSFLSTKQDGAEKVKMGKTKKVKLVKIDGRKLMASKWILIGNVRYVKSTKLILRPHATIGTISSASKRK